MTQILLIMLESKTSFPLVKVAVMAKVVFLVVLAVFIHLRLKALAIPSTQSVIAILIKQRKPPEAFQANLLPIIKIVGLATLTLAACIPTILNIVASKAAILVTPSAAAVAPPPLPPPIHLHHLVTPTTNTNTVVTLRIKIHRFQRARSGS